MPQLDKFTFLDQVLSVVFFLLIIYILNVYVFLPKLIYILKFRARTLKTIKKKQKMLNVLLSFNKRKEQLSYVFYFSVFGTINKNIIEILKNHSFFLQNAAFVALSKTSE